MPIQFTCPGCLQPIEVDDVIAGQTAACPYCRRVVSVPAESTYDTQAVTSARPAAAPEDGARPRGTHAPDRDVGGPPPLGGLHVGPPPNQRQRAAAAYGRYAIICAAIAVALFVVVGVYALKLTAQIAGEYGDVQPTPEEIQERLQKTPASPYLMAGGCGMPFFALAGLGLSIASLAQSRRGNWRGWVGLAGCGACLSCFALGAILQLLLFSGASLP